jgi:hypothetical protein
MLCRAPEKRRRESVILGRFYRRLDTFAGRDDENSIIEAGIVIRDSPSLQPSFSAQRKENERKSRAADFFSITPFFLIPRFKRQPIFVSTAILNALIFLLHFHLQLSVTEDIF